MHIPVPVVSIIANTFKGVLLNGKINTIVDDIKANITKVYKDIGQAHFNAAKDALASAKNGFQKKVEINSAINHFREAYHINLALLDKKQKVTDSYLFGLFKDSYEVPVINYDETSEYSLGICDIATLISLCYAELYEYSSAKIWKERAIEHYIKYLEKVKGDIDLKYMEVKGWVSYTETTLYRGGPWSDSYKVRNACYTDKGWLYIEEQNQKKREEMQKEFVRDFKKMKIN